MLCRAVEQADNLRQIEILRVAVDNRWASVVASRSSRSGAASTRSQTPSRNSGTSPQAARVGLTPPERKRTQCLSHNSNLRSTTCAHKPQAFRSDRPAPATSSPTTPPSPTSADRPSATPNATVCATSSATFARRKPSSSTPRSSRSRSGCSGCRAVASSDPGQVLLYRDAQDRAARLTQSDEAAQVFAAALRSDDKILAAAVLGRALDAGWNSIIDEYVKHNPSAGEDLKDLAKLRQYQSSKPPSPTPGAHNHPNGRRRNDTHR